jgi:N-acetylglutamate synthase-like GNAT family acetyltransferase
MNENFTASTEAFLVRRFESRDREAVLALWPAAVMQLQPRSDTLDVLIHSVEGAIAGKDQVWVAEASGRIIGSAAVICTNASLAHLRCLCVAPDVAERHVVARGLAELAIRDAYKRGYLKLVVHTEFPPNRLTAALHDLGFEFSRERSTSEEHVLEFYQNLYEQPRPSVSERGQSV